MKENSLELERRRAAAELGGGQERIDAQHQRGKLTRTTHGLVRR